MQSITFFQFISPKCYNLQKNLLLLAKSQSNSFNNLTKGQFPDSIDYMVTIAAWIRYSVYSIYLHFLSGYKYLLL